MILQGLLLIDAFESPEMGWLAIEHGRIAEIGHGEPPERADIGDDHSVICPGFIDAHLHLPQIDCIGCDGLSLLDWLDRVIYPAEVRWADETVAKRQIATAYVRMVKAGTLGFAGYLTSHFHGYANAVRVGHGLPLRAIMGQVLMDRHAPAQLLGHQQIRLARSERARIATSVNPRFAVACSDECLAAAGKKATLPDGTGAYIQTHLAETPQECELVRKLFPKDRHSTAVYDRHGLLTERTLLAHCVHLSNEEWQLIAKRLAVVVHCPTANVFLKSGMFDLDSAREHKVRLALGSDVAAGPDISMPRVARAMIEVAKMRAVTIKPRAHIPTPAESWNLITCGNADALGWTDAGRLEVGAAADLLVLKPPFDLDGFLLGRLIYTWDDDYIAHRIVNGVAVTDGPPLAA
jgi:guanine deaminase